MIIKFKIFLTSNTNASVPIHILDAAVMTVITTDYDEGENAVVIYSLPDTSPFKINESTGLISLTPENELDREIQDIYFVVVQANNPDDTCTICTSKFLQGENFCKTMTNNFMERRQLKLVFSYQARRP